MLGLSLSLNDLRPTGKTRAAICTPARALEFLDFETCYIYMCLVESNRTVTNGRQTIGQRASCTAWGVAERDSIALIVAMLANPVGVAETFFRTKPNGATHAHKTFAERASGHAINRPTHNSVAVFTDRWLFVLIGEAGNNTVALTRESANITVVATEGEPRGIQGGFDFMQHVGDPAGVALIRN